MKKTIQVNLGGSVFFIDEDAYQLLDIYLNKIKEYLSNNEDRDEIITDIELRIAELLYDKRTSKTDAITINHIEEIISIMGEPEAFRMDADTEEGNSFTQNETGKANKKFFRDPDDRFIGGVASGLAHYIGIEPVWMRLLTVILVLAGVGSPIVVYIILWIVVPEAKTTSEKLQMKGKPVNLSNIEKTLKKEYDNVAEKVKNVDLKKRSAIFFDGLMKVGKILLRVFLVFLSLILLLVSLVVIIALIISLIAPSLTILPEIYDNIDFNSITYKLWHIAISISLGIPFIGLFILSLHIINPKLKPLGKITKTSMLLIWIVAVGYASYFFYYAAQSTKYPGRSLEHTELSINPTDTLLIQTKKHPTLSHINNRLDYKIEKDKDGNYYIFGTDFEFSIKPTNENEAYIVIEKYAKSKSSEEAGALAKKIEYHYELTDNVLSLNDYFIQNNTKKNSKSKVRAYINLPRNMVFKIDKTVSKNTARQLYTKELVPNEIMQIKDNLIICIDCKTNSNNSIEEKSQNSKQTNNNSDAWEKRVEEAFEELN